MKRFFWVFCLIITFSTTKAQFYVGGSVGFGLVKQNGNETQTTYKIIPEVGYCINDVWSVGIALGYKKGSCLVGKSYYEQNVRSKAIGVQPYVRFTPIHVSIVDVIVDGCFTYESILDEGVNMNIGLKPGISIRPINHLTIVSHIGFLGAELYKSNDGEIKNGIAGLELDASSLLLGLFYTF